MTISGAGCDSLTQSQTSSLVNYILDEMQVDPSIHKWKLLRNR